ncbi:hypothetical protein B0H14DRAFT_3866605 [Mycena olivaceomarginata]|nr:hypothetical protein B0H14DRAFT_3866605 [Mycena olivaceomarginata]
MPTPPHAGCLSWWIPRLAYKSVSVLDTCIFHVPLPSSPPMSSSSFALPTSPHLPPLPASPHRICSVTLRVFTAHHSRLGFPSSPYLSASIPRPAVSSSLGVPAISFFGKHNFSLWRRLGPRYRLIGGAFCASFVIRGRPCFGALGLCMIVGLHLVALPAGLEIVLLVSRDSPCPPSPTTSSPRLSSRLSLRPLTPRHSISCTLDSAYPSLVHLHDLASLLLRNALPLPVTSPFLPSSSSSSQLPWHSSSAQAPYLFRVVPPSLCLLLISRPFRSHSLSSTFISLRSRVPPSCWTSDSSVTPAFPIPHLAHPRFHSMGRYNSPCSL